MAKKVILTYLIGNMADKIWVMKFKNMNKDKKSVENSSPPDQTRTQSSPTVI